MKFDFNEANILKQNFYQETDNKEILIHRLTNLQTTTSDHILQDAVVSLIKKIEALNPEQIQQIYLDIIENRFIATANYNYPLQKTKALPDLI